ncbi:MAG: DUF47 family protein [Desulfurococcaceae archaeon]
MQEIGGRLYARLQSMLNEHAEEAVKSVESLSRLYAMLAGGDVEGASREYAVLNGAEHRADEIKRQILSYITGLHLDPDYKENIMKLVMTVDDVAGLAKASAKRLLSVGKSGVRIGEPYASGLGKMIGESLAAARELAKVVSTLGTSEEFQSVARSVEESEKRVDDERLKLLEHLYNECARSLGPACVMLPGIIDDVESITDKCEDAVAILRFMALRG